MNLDQGQLTFVQWWYDKDKESELERGAMILFEIPKPCKTNLNTLLTSKLAGYQVGAKGLYEKEASLTRACSSKIDQRQRFGVRRCI